MHCDSMLVTVQVNSGRRVSTMVRANRCTVLVLWSLPKSIVGKELAQWSERAALPKSLPAVWLRTPLVSNIISCNKLLQYIMFLSFQYWDIALMLCLWARHFTFKCFTWIRWKNEYLVGSVYDQVNVPKWLQNCMLSVESKWHTNEQVQWPGRRPII